MWFFSSLLTKLCAQLWLEINPRNSRYLPNCAISWTHAGTTVKRQQLPLGSSSMLPLSFCMSLQGRPYPSFTFLPWFTYDKIEYWKMFYTEVHLKIFLPINFTFFLNTFFISMLGLHSVFLLKKQMFHHSKGGWEARRCNVRGGNPQGGCRSAHSMLLPPVNRGWTPVSSKTQKYHGHICYTLIQTLIILGLRSLLQTNLLTGLSNEKKTLFTLQQLSKCSN